MAPESHKRRGRRHRRYRALTRGRSLPSASQEDLLDASEAIAREAILATVGLLVSYLAGKGRLD